MYKMVIKDNCPVCEHSKQKLNAANLIGKVELVHISTSEGLALAKQYKLKMAGSNIIDTENSNVMTVDEFISSQQ